MWGKTDLPGRDECVVRITQVAGPQIGPEAGPIAPRLPLGEASYMSDVDRLLAAFADGSLVRPSVGGLSIVDLSRAAARVAGAPDVQPTPGSDKLSDLIGRSDHLIFIIVDGLGKSLIQQLPSDSFLASHEAAELTTVFPSTTATALTSIATGAWPNSHAVTGWWTHLGEIGGAAVILQFVRRSDGRSLADLGVEPETAFPVASLVSRIPRDTLMFLPEAFVDSVYSLYISGGRQRVGFKSLREAVTAVVERVHRATGPTYTYLYAHRIDAVAHAYGSRHPETRAALHELDRQLERLWRGLAGSGRIVLSADHGFLDIPRSARHRVGSNDNIMDTLRFPPSGDARVLFLHVRRGAEGGAAQRFRERFGQDFMLIPVDEAEKLELFGPGDLSATAKSRMGDFIAVSKGPDVVEYQPSGGTPKTISQASHHSGLTPDEMLVPLILA